MKIALEKAKETKLFYFVVTGVIYHPKKKKCLILQRSKSEKAHPGLWGVVGGKLEWEDILNTSMSRQNHDIFDWEGLVDKLLIREAFEESGLKVGDLHYLNNVVFLRPDNIPVVCIKFGVKYISGKVKIPPEFDDFVWVNEREVKRYKTIKGISEEVYQTIKIFSEF